MWGSPGSTHLFGVPRVVPIEDELEDDDAVEEGGEDVLELIEEVVGLHEDGAEAGEDTQEGQQEGEEGQLARRLVLEVREDLRDT